VDRDGDRWGRALCVLAVRPQRCGLSAANIVANAKPISTNAGQVLARLNLTVEKAWPHALDLVNRRRQPIARIACHLSRFGTVDETALSALL